MHLSCFRLVLRTAGRVTHQLRTAWVRAWVSNDGWHLTEMKCVSVPTVPVPTGVLTFSSPVFGRLSEIKYTRANAAHGRSDETGSSVVARPFGVRLQFLFGAWSALEYRSSSRAAKNPLHPLGQAFFVLSAGKAASQLLVMCFFRVVRLLRKTVE